MTQEEAPKFQSVYLGEQMDEYFSEVPNKQDTLVSGTNIKTINNTSVLGAGNIAVQVPLVSGTNIKTINNNSILGSGNIDIQGGGGSNFNVRVIDASDPTQWDDDEPTEAVIQDIIENDYQALHLDNVNVDGMDIDGWMFILNSVDVQGTIAKYFYHFDEGDEDEGTSPNIETWLFVKQPDGEGSYNYSMVVQQYSLGSEVSGADDGTDWTSITINDVTKSISNCKKYNATFDLSQGFPTLSQTDLENIYNNKPDVINLSAGTTITIGYKTREDSAEYKVWYSTTVVEQGTPTVYIITIEYDYANSQYIFTMDDYSLTSNV